MVWLIVGLAIVVIGIAWIAGQRRLGGMPPLVEDRPGLDLPDADLTSEDLRHVRLAVTTRGYSMQQVDALLERLANQLDGQHFQAQDAYDAWLAVPPPPAPIEDAPAPAEDAEGIPAPVEDAPAPVEDAPAPATDSEKAGDESPAQL